jgi:hypothetical protein
MVIPLIALEPDIKGVCSVGGTLVMTSKPTKIANRNTVKLPTNTEALDTFRRPLSDVGADSLATMGVVGCSGGAD